ncbi:MAG: IS110 family transposase [Bacteroidetes bacterium]|nr:IS110 family transposase [Bacteroidota bacterium]
MKEHVVAVPEDRDKESVRSFKSFSRDLHKLAKWLKSCNIETVAMESTGVYWYHLYTVLLDYGFTVDLVNAAHVQNVPGRKSDVSDARWLQELHSFGLLRGCFQPDNLTRSLRNFVRQRKTIIKDMTTQTQRMQKALEQMNIKLNNVIRDINGKTGRAIIVKILEGERDPVVLSQYADGRIKCKRETLIKSLEGNWREEQLFNLKQGFDHLSFLEQQLIDCDKESEKMTSKFSSVEKDKLPPNEKKKNQPCFNVKQYLYEIHGVDVTKIHGFKNTTALTVFSEIGPNIEQKFPTLKQFLSWLNVVPDNKITGGKVISSRVRKKKNRAGQAFREAANALWNANNPLGDTLRHKKAKSGSSSALVSTAKKIATIYYKMIVNQEEFDPDKLAKKSKEHLTKKLEKLKKSIEKTELQLAYL